jgi:hypothetical protein
MADHHTNLAESHLQTVSWSILHGEFLQSAAMLLLCCFSGLCALDPHPGTFNTAGTSPGMYFPKTHPDVAVRWHSPSSWCPAPRLQGTATYGSSIASRLWWRSVWSSFAWGLVQVEILGVESLLEVLVSGGGGGWRSSAQYDSPCKAPLTAVAQPSARFTPLKGTKTAF